MEFKLWLERSKPKKIIAYHGTSSKLIPAILSQGLIPDPKTRSWATDDNTSFHSPSRASYGGIYVTTNLMTASSSAWRTAADTDGDKAIVIMELQPRTLIDDEDNVNNRISNIKSKGMNFNEHWLIQLYVALKTNNDNRDWLEKVREEHTEMTLDQLFRFRTEEPHPELLKRVKSMIESGFEAVLTRQIANIDPSEYKQSMHRAMTEQEVPQPDLAQAERDFMQFSDKLTKTLKAGRDTTTFNYTARIMEPIKFSGANKIIGIVEFSKLTSSETPKVVFGTVPQDFKDQYKMSFGKWED
jgi:hypothetical protein